LATAHTWRDTCVALSSIMSRRGNRALYSSSDAIAFKWFSTMVCCTACHSNLAVPERGTTGRGVLCGISPGWLLNVSEPPSHTLALRGFGVLDVECTWSSSTIHTTVSTCTEWIRMGGGSVKWLATPCTAPVLVLVLAAWSDEPLTESCGMRRLLQDMLV
jgi:hypothetical protein